MKNKLILTVLLLFIAGAVNAQGINPELFKKMKENHTVYVNTKAPGVRRVYDEKYGGYVWKNSVGGYICRDENMKPLADIDKDVTYEGSSDPNAKFYVHKEWDPERGCYVWRDTQGSFLGRDDSEAKKIREERLKELKKAQKNKTGIFSDDDEDDWDEDMDDDNDEDIDLSDLNINGGGSLDLDNMSDEQLRNLVIRSDAELADAEAAMREMRKAMSEASAAGVDLSEYMDMDIINRVQEAIDKYKSARKRMNQNK